MLKKLMWFLAIMSFSVIFTMSCASKKVALDKDVGADTGVTNVDIDDLCAQISEKIDKDLLEVRGKTMALRAIDNMTSEHFNTKIIGEKIKDAIKRKSGVIFVERDKLTLLKDEQALIDETAQHVQERKKLWGADYLLYGRIDAIDKTAKRAWNPITQKQETYYRLNITITNTTTGVELWSGDAEFKKTQVQSRW
ncbi:MAG TPA: CsgG/HfaB family protein [bacterium]|nr:CsgG/HfaB family protein [bacterium]